MQNMKVFLFTVLCIVAQSSIAQDSWSDEQWDDGWDAEQNQSVNVYGYVEAAIGGRFESSPITSVCLLPNLDFNWVLTNVGKILPGQQRPTAGTTALMKPGTAKFANLMLSLRFSITPI